MKAFKGLNPDLTCRGYQFKEFELNQTEEANCRNNGFHCAENPLDCLNYYSNWNRAVYYEVEASGDIDEDEIDSKVSCTRIRLVRKLTLKQFLFEALVYMVQHPKRKWNDHVQEEHGTATEGFVIVRGKNPIACGKKGDMLALIKEDNTGDISEVGLFEAEESDIWYDVTGSCVENVALQSEYATAAVA